jgi:6-phosphogluconolactonase (cycloisomerase 2 family)
MSIRRTTGATASALGLLAGAAAALAPGAAQAHGFPPGGGHGRGGAAFVQTNDPAGNAIVAYSRGRDGQLTPAGRHATRGLGGTQAAAPTDPLASQGSLVLDRRDDRLYAVNAGSDTISVFAVHGTSLRLLQVLPSGGDFPTSVAVSDGLVYVLNAGGDGTVSGFRSRFGVLRPLAGSTRSLGLGNATPPFFLSSPAQVGFTPDADELLVTTKNHGDVDAFRLDRSGRPAAAPVQTSTGPVPFAFAFDARQRLVLVDASSSANTYRVSGSGTIDPVGTPAANGQTATCWLASARGYWYASNTGSNTITGYAENDGGQLSLLVADGVSAATDGGPIDIASAPDGRFLYELNGTAGTLGIYAVGADGLLTRSGTVTGLPAFDGHDGMQGLAVD